MEASHLRDLQSQLLSVFTDLRSKGTADIRTTHRLFQLHNQLDMGPTENGYTCSRCVQRVMGRVSAYLIEHKLLAE